MQRKSIKEMLLRIASSARYDKQSRKDALDKLLEDEGELKSELFETFQKRAAAGETGTSTEEDLERVYAEVAERLKLKDPDGQTATTHKRKPAKWYRYAAAAAVMIAIIYGGIQMGSQKKKQDLATLSSPAQHRQTGAQTRDTLFNNGEEKEELLLPDSTGVTLYPQSYIVFSKALYMKRERALAIAGKAIFNVHHMSQNSFFVDAGKIRVQDIGTVFSVEYTGQKVVSHLIKGKIVIHSNEGTFKDLAMQPQTEFVFSEQTNNYVVRRDKPSEQREQRSGAKPDALAFNNTPLRDVMTKIAETSGYTITWNGNEKKLQLFTGTFPASENIHSIITKLSLATGIHCTINGKAIIID